MYHYPLYRPPSEAKSLILQLTLGCAHNKCTFCNMYKSKEFYIKTPQEIEEHIKWGKKQYKSASRIFLADGNALAMKTSQLVEILASIYRVFPNLERVSSYAAPKDLLRKTPQELKELKQAGLEMIYLGVESGSDIVLQAIKKGVSALEMIEAGKKAVEAGFILSCMVISGLGGKELWKEHALETAKVISAIKPHYFSPLTLMIEQGTELKRSIEKREFQLLSPKEVLDELELMISNLDLENCIFRSNHASNYVPLRGILNKDKEHILEQINQIRETQGYKSENLRGL